MSSWEIKNNIIKPKEKMKCPFDSQELLLHDFRVGHHSQKNFYHVDVHLKCWKCGLWLTFGIPLSKEDYIRLRDSELHGKILTTELLEEINDQEIKKSIETRLKKLGYW